MSQPLIINIKTLKDILSEANADRNEDDAFIVEGVLEFGIGGEWPTVGDEAKFFVGGEAKEMLPVVREYVARQNAIESQNLEDLS